MNTAEKALKSNEIERNKLADQVVGMLEFLTLREFENLVKGLPEDVAKIVLIKLVRKVRQE